MRAVLNVAVQVERLRSAVKASVDGNRRLLDESRYRIAASRRRLNPVFAFAGGSAESDPFRIAIRERLITGGLFRLDPAQRSRSGPGSGQVCAVCPRRIGSGQPEHLVDGAENGRIVFAHAACYVIWREESDAPGTAHSTSSG